MVDHDAAQNSSSVGVHDIYLLSPNCQLKSKQCDAS